MLKKLNDMHLRYFVQSFKGRNIVYRILGPINESVKTLESFYNGEWSDHVDLNKSFMNKVVTGWLDDEDALSYEEAISILKANIDLAKDLALVYHGGQLYGTHPYEYHLAHVIEVLEQNNIFPNTEKNIDLYIVGWLHDVLEDTQIDKILIAESFGEHILKIIESLTDGEGNTRAIKKEDMMNRLVQNQSGIIVKLADRISNIQRCIDDNNHDKLKMYLDENNLFSQRLEAAIDTENGLTLLKSLQELVVSINTKH